MTAKFELTLFIVTEASVPRIINALLSLGFGITPLCQHRKGVGHGTVTHLVGKGSTVMSLELTTQTTQGASDATIAIINKLATIDVPYYGGLLETKLSGSVHLLMGHMPTKTQVPTKSPPAEATGGQVIPFKKKPN